MVCSVRVSLIRATRFAEVSVNGSLRTRFGGARQRLDPVGDALRGLAQLPDRPVGGIAFGDIVGARVVDQPLGQRARQQQVALGHRDEAVTQTVVPELRTTGFPIRL